MVILHQFPLSKMPTKVTYRHGCWSHVQNPRTGLGDQTPEGLTNSFGVGIVINGSDHPLAVNTLALRSSFGPPELPDGRAVFALRFDDASLLHGILLHRDVGALGLSRNQAEIIGFAQAVLQSISPSGSTGFMCVHPNRPAASAEPLSMRHSAAYSQHGE
jgi:hypothetical protein